MSFLLIISQLFRFCYFSIHQCFVKLCGYSTTCIKLCNKTIHSKSVVVSLKCNVAYNQNNVINVVINFEESVLLCIKFGRDVINFSIVIIE